MRNRSNTSLGDSGMGTMGTTGCMKGEMSSVVVQQGSVGVLVEAGPGGGDGACVAEKALVDAGVGDGA